MKQETCERNKVEAVYNLFLFVEGDTPKGIGVASHVVDGSDSEKISFLQRHVALDFIDAVRYPLPIHEMRVWLGLGPAAEITFDMFSYLSRTGNALRVFEYLLQDMGAPADPLVCISPIVNGVPRIDLLTHIDPPSVQGEMIASRFKATITQTDFFAKHLVDGHLELDSLLEEDFVAAIKLLNRCKHYVSAMKLLVSFVDTLAYLEYGDIQGNFVSWVTAYTDLDSIGVTPAELWEFRNSLLHMTSPHSRKVLDGKHPALCFYTHPKRRRVIVAEEEGGKMFSFEAIYESVMNGVSSWSATYSGDIQKQLLFINRYDEILSEGRIASLSGIEDPGGIDPNGRQSL